MWSRLKEDPSFRELRREINEAKGRAHQLLSSLHVPTVFVQYPAPAVGGPVLRFNMFDLVTENRAYDPISVDTFLDKIDEAIGKLKAAPSPIEPKRFHPFSRRTGSDAPLTGGPKANRVSLP